MKDYKLLRRTGAASVLVTLFSLPALGQQTGTTPESGEQDAADTVLEEVIVLGSQIAGVDPVGSDPILLSRDDAVRTGLANTADILRRLPQNQQAIGGAQSFQGGTANQGYNGAQVEGINLRGLGSNATLILVDGRRVVGAGGAATQTDANQVPVRALERLEVLVDGASAIYGSDAVAGVVNFVLRKDFEGFEVTLRADDQSGGTQYGGSLIAGGVWDGLGSMGRGNILFTYEHLDRDAFTSGEIPRLRQDLRPLGGPDLRLNNDDASVGFSPNIITQFLGPNLEIPRAGNYTYFGVPEGDGTGLTVGDLAYNQPNLVDGSDYTDWTGEQKRDQLAVYFNQELSENWELFSSLTYTERDTVSEHRSASARVPLAGSPYYLLDLPPDQTVQYSTLKDNLVREFSADATTWQAALGIRWDMPGNWNGEAYINYGRNEQCDSCVTGSINIQALTAQVFAGNINPLSSNPLTAEQINSVYGDSSFESRTTLEQAVVKFDGPLYDLSGGTLSAAVGAEYRTETNSNRNISRTGPANEFTQISTYAGTKYDRDVGSLFLELYIPVTENLNASAAVRYDDYSDFGSTTNPKFGFTWNVTDQFRFQGTWGTSFRAPTVTDVNPNAVTSGSALVLPNWDPDIANGVLPPGILGPFGLTNSAVMLGSNPDLMHEEAETWTLTAGFEHEGFAVDLTYWNIEYDDQIIFPGSLFAYLGATPADVPANGGNYGGWESLIIPVYNPVTCDNSDISTADPVLQPFLETVNYDFIAGGGDYSTLSTLDSDFCKVNVIIDSRIQNVGKVEKSGIDFNFSWAGNAGDVDLIGQLAVTHYLKNDITTGPSQPAYDGIGDLADPNSVFEWHGLASFSTLWRGWDGTIAVRYLDSILATNQVGSDGLPGPDRNLSAYYPFDLTLGYSADRSGVLKWWRAQFVVTNIFDTDPDFFVVNGSATGNSWDFKYGLPFGRTYSFQLTTTF